MVGLLEGGDPADAGFAEFPDAAPPDAPSRPRRDASVRDSAVRDVPPPDARSVEFVSCAEGPVTLGRGPASVVMLPTPEGDVRVVWSDERRVNLETLIATRRGPAGRLIVGDFVELDRPVRDGARELVLMRWAGRGTVLDLGDASFRFDAFGIFQGLSSSGGVARWLIRSPDTERIFVDTSAPSSQLVYFGFMRSTLLTGGLTDEGEEWLILEDPDRVIQRRADGLREVALDGLEPRRLVRLPGGRGVFLIAQQPIKEGRRQLVVRRVDLDGSPPLILTGSRSLPSVPVDAVGFIEPTDGRSRLALAWADNEAGPVAYAVVDPAPPDAAQPPVIRTIAGSINPVGATPAVAWEPSIHGLTVAWHQAVAIPSLLQVRCQLPY